METLYWIEIYEEFEGWDDNIANARCYEDLPKNAIKYLKKIEDFTETKVSIVSVGPKRDQTMMISEI